MNPDRGREPYPSSEQKDPPQALLPLTYSKIDDAEHRDPRRDESATKARPIVRYERDESWVDRAKVGNVEPHEFEVLRHEDRGRTEHRDRRPPRIIPSAVASRRARPTRARPTSAALTVATRPDEAPP